MRLLFHNAWWRINRRSAQVVISLFEVVGHLWVSVRPVDPGSRQGHSQSAFAENVGWLQVELQPWLLWEGASVCLPRCPEHKKHLTLFCSDRDLANPGSAVECFPAQAVLWSPSHCSWSLSSRFSQELLLVYRNAAGDANGVWDSSQLSSQGGFAYERPSRSSRLAGGVIFCLQAILKIDVWLSSVQSLSILRCRCIYRDLGSGLQGQNTLLKEWAQEKATF